MKDAFVCFQGNITLGLFGEIAPLTVENLVGLMQGSLENRNGYTGAIFHRVIHNFMMQVGHQNLKINIRKHSSMINRFAVLATRCHQQGQALYKGDPWIEWKHNFISRWLINIFPILYATVPQHIKWMVVVIIVTRWSLLLLLLFFFECHDYHCYGYRTVTTIVVFVVGWWLLTTKWKRTWVLHLGNGIRRRNVPTSPQVGACLYCASV